MMRVWRLSNAWRPSVCRVHRASVENREIWKSKIGTEVAHVTRDSDSTFMIKNLKGQRSTYSGAGHIMGAFRTACSFRIVYLGLSATAHTQEG